jgi:hypothetical protein
VHGTTGRLDALAVDADGARRASLDLGGGDGPAVTVPGVYPVELTVTDSAGAEARMVSHLVVRPAIDTTSPPLAVAVLASVEADDLADPGAAAALVDAVNAASDVPVTMAVRPDAVDPLLDAAADQPGAALLASLRAASGRPWLALPYARVSPDALAAAGVPEELLHQLGHGSAVLRDVLGASAEQTTWLAGPDLGGEGLALLPSNGVDHVLVDPDQVQEVSDGVLSVARPFLLAPPRGERAEDDGDGAVDAMVLDTRIRAQVDADDEPALVANRVLAELASLWFEQERTPRGVAIPVGTSVDAATLGALLDGLRAPRLFDAVPVDDLFTRAAPLQTRGAPLSRALVPDDGPSLSGSVATRVRSTRALRSSVVTMVRSDAPFLDEVDRHLLRATSVDLDGDEQRAELRAARDAVDRFRGSITTQERFTITLTARAGTVPLTIRNDSGVPVEVEVRLRSSRLELPDGDRLTVRLDEATTRRDIAVRARASGSSTLEIEVVSPDGELAIASARYAVRSTAVSGVGLVASAGAGLFLIIWWARHWRQTRRSAKLVDSAEPRAGAAGQPIDP